MLSEVSECEPVSNSEFGVLIGVVVDRLPIVGTSFAASVFRSHRDRHRCHVAEDAAPCGAIAH